MAPNGEWRGFGLYIEGFACLEGRLGRRALGQEANPPTAAAQAGDEDRRGDRQWDQPQGRKMAGMKPVWVPCSRLIRGCGDDTRP